MAESVAAIVVIPARDEEACVAGCLRALASQTTDAFEVIVVLDACSDHTAEVAAAVAEDQNLALTLLHGPGLGTGPARRIGMDAACRRLHELGLPAGLIATTDADTRPARDWLARQLRHRDHGAAVIAGRIELDPAESDALPAAVRARRERDAAARLRLVHRDDPDAAHHHFAGASLSITATAYCSVGGLEPLSALEDEAFAARLLAHRIPILRAPDVLVTTSARTDGRAQRGLSVDLAVSRWMAMRRYHARQFPLAELTAAKPATTAVSVIIPTKECAETIASVLNRAVGPARAAGLVDELLVVDAGSRDGTAQVAERHGARVLQQDRLVPELGPAAGKGDAMWRALHVSSGDIVCFMDGDTVDPDPAHLLGLLGPLLLDDTVEMVKGAFERPFQSNGHRVPHEGGRVTELMARPLINMHFPSLAGFSQPLAGEFAARRPLLEEVPFPVGYGVETATLIDALHARGLDALAETDLGTRQNRHQPLRALGEMAYAILAAVERRLPHEHRASISARYVKPWDDGAISTVAVTERPPVRDRRPGLAVDGGRSSGRDPRSGGNGSALRD
ncbi:MAG TPA: glucosyl-3-phosphoglycerate synthase [Solirubrobacteraceae bacterium]|nr:glucosyl-3-phosphoglycerate synthase [Solirubrobacteraceae bacterium]